jgi:hypothetical protein
MPLQWIVCRDLIINPSIKMTKTNVKLNILLCWHRKQVYRRLPSGYVGEGRTFTRLIV